MTTPNANQQPDFRDLYRGVVVSNFDPMQQNRIMVRVDDVLGDDPCIWATPQYATSGMHVVPAVQSGVWIKFEDGDVNRAVWTGFWRGGTVEQPPVATMVPPEVPQVVLSTPAGNYLLLADATEPTGGIRLQLHGQAGPYIKLSEAGIELSCGPGLASIRLAGTSVIINNGTFVVPK
ncbi:phage baseplate assembly protein V [Streptomyces sp. NPDC055722]